MGKRLIIPGADFSANAIEMEPITVPVEYTLQNGFASRGSDTIISLDDDASANLIRVRTNQLEGSYAIKTKTGYVIRALVTYGTSIDTSTPGNITSSDVVSVPNVQGETEFTLDNEGAYSIITFCKINASQAISASEDIVDYIIRPLES